ncbi:E3 ubiquitin-protein ligase herc2 [Phtheirospermum japonicum]|uniref:E3 ubiquitin-protein ligase herc2 n=1 Tax=Phtheirospermum japonicum TaxID=374723 RepID=A0A830CZ28_9LAMI|nr:E3 ubiquitin-protein ligase herc2 [Phtheirospermum japonicum]
MSYLPSSTGDRDTGQAINALKRGSYLLKYGRWGKPKFCPFQLSNDEKTLIWYSGKDQKQIRLSQVSRIIPGQRTKRFQRYPQPEKEYQSFSLIYGKKSLDVICKDKCEAETWFVALRALLSQGNCRKWGSGFKTDATLSDCSSDQTERSSLSILSNSSEDAIHEAKQSHRTYDLSSERLPQKRLVKVLSDVSLHKASSLQAPKTDSGLCSVISPPNETVSRRNSVDSFRLSYSSAVSTSSLESSPGDIPLSVIFICGEPFEDDLLNGESYPKKDAFSPKVLESASALDAQHIACGSRHAVLITRQGQVFSWGDGSGGKLGHGSQADIPNPQLVNALAESNIVSVGCGEYHTCAVTITGDLYTWGDGIHNFGLLGHGTELSYWVPRKIRGPMEGICVTSISCGPWHSAAITSLGQLFTFGDGTFGALGHGDRCCISVPREVSSLKGQRAVRISCGFWHTAAIIEVCSESPSCSNPIITGKLFTWGNGEDGQLGLGDKLCRLVPCSVTMPNERNICQVACGQSITVALTLCGQVYTMGSTKCKEPKPVRIEGKLKSCHVKEISCGSHHVVALTSTSEVFTWGKGRNGQLGHGDNADRDSPTLVKALEGKQVKRVICGNNFTAVICLHQWVCAVDYSNCAGCRNPFNFKRKRHNCYNCGLFFCTACTSKRSLGASLALNPNKLYPVCEDCFAKLKNGLSARVNSRPPKSSSSPCVQVDPSSESKKESSKSKQRGVLARLSSFDSFRRSNSQLSKKNQKVESSSTPNSPFQGGKLRCSKSFVLSSSTSMLDSCETMNVGPKMHYASSPVSTKSSPGSLSLASSFCSAPDHEEVIDEPNRPNDDLTEEISFLKEQVEALSNKTRFLATELVRTSNQLNEATALFQVESEKNNAAKASIKCLTNQLNEMAARASQGASCRAFGPFGDNMWHILNTAST